MALIFFSGVILAETFPLKNIATNTSRLIYWAVKIYLSPLTPNTGGTIDYC